MHLALYLAEHNEEDKNKRRENLVKSIENWYLYAGDLAHEVPRDGTHNLSLIHI